MQGNGIATIPEGTLPPEVAGYMQNVQLMHGIVAEMKEIPVLQSEVPTDTNALEKVEFPDEGGILTYMSGHPLPYRGFPYFEFVEKIDLIKKISRNTLSGLYHTVKHKNKFRLLLMFPLIFLAKDLISTTARTFHRLIERSRIKSKLYSRAVRAIYMAFDTPRANEELEVLELRLMLKDIVCTILEFDNAYRYRMQDVIVELDKKALKKNTIKELLRLMDVMSSREQTQEVKDTWRLLVMGIKYYLRFDRKLQRMVADVLSNLDLEQVRLTPEDEHFAGMRKDYKCKFLNHVSN